MARHEGGWYCGSCGDFFPDKAPAEVMMWRMSHCTKCGVEINDDHCDACNLMFLTPKTVIVACVNIEKALHDEHIKADNLMMRERFKASIFEALRAAWQASKGVDDLIIASDIVTFSRFELVEAPAHSGDVHITDVSLIESKNALDPDAIVHSTGQPFGCNADESEVTDSTQHDNPDNVRY